MYSQSFCLTPIGQIRIFGEVKFLSIFRPGDTCEIDTTDECEGVRCERGGVCRDRPGNYVCDCPAQWNGRRCTEHDPSFAGGEGVDVPADPGTQGGSPFWRQCKMKTKTGHACVDVFRDKICNPECNVEAVRRTSYKVFDFLIISLFFCFCNLRYNFLMHKNKTIDILKQSAKASAYS